MNEVVDDEEPVSLITMFIDTNLAATEEFDSGCKVITSTMLMF